MDNDQIDKMVDNFLRWELPDDFDPDGGITYHYSGAGKPTGTNLLTATRAREMIEYILTGDNKMTENRKSLEAVENIKENVSIPDA